MKSKLIANIIFCLLYYPVLVHAGPGGKIASALADTLLGKIIIGVLVILFLPLIIYVMIKEFLAQRRIQRELRYVAKYSPEFEWIKIRQRMRDCFMRVHSAWEKSDVSEAAKWMTDWYWQNQQAVFLDRWERENLRNICEVDIINSIKPIMFSFRCDENQPGEGSELAVLINAKMRDYLINKLDGKVVEGSRKKKDVERIWNFTLENGKWVVSNIEERSNTLAYIRMMKDIPRIEKVLNMYGLDQGAENR